MYYFVVFDHGLSRMAKSLNRLLNSEEVDHGDMLLVKSCVTLLVNESIEMGTETKADWEDTIEGCTPGNLEGSDVRLAKSKRQTWKQESDTVIG